MIFELFADKNEVEFQVEDEDEREIGLNQITEAGHARIQTENRSRELVTQRNYSALAEKVFSMLVQSTFDEDLFADLSQNPDAELMDVFSNMDLSRGVGGQSKRKGGPTTTSSKIFALMAYALSPRFTHSRPFVCKVLKMMLQKIGSLDLEFSNRFHEGLGRMAAELVELKETGREADALLGQVFELGDLEIVFDSLTDKLGLHLSDPNILTKEKFTHLLYIFGKHCKGLHFDFYVKYLLPLLRKLLEKPAEHRGQMEKIIMKKLFLSIAGFRNFDQIFKSTPQDIQFVSGIILTDLFKLSEELKSLQPSFYAMLQRFLLAAQELSETGESALVRNTIISQIRSSNLLGKFCGKMAKPTRTVLEENCLQLVARVLPKDYIESVFEKNAVRLSAFLDQPDKVARALAEGLILGFICKASGQLFRDDKIYRLQMAFIEKLLSLKSSIENPNSPLKIGRAADKKKWILQASCLALKLLTFLIPKVNWKLYTHLLAAAQSSVRSEKITEQITGNDSSLLIETESGNQDPKKAKHKTKTKEMFLAKHDQHALKFCVELMKSAQLNMNPESGLERAETLNNERQMLLQSLAESFLPVAMVNIKTRNIKTRAHAKLVLKSVVSFEHAHSKRLLQIQATSLSVSSIIAGLAGSSPYLRSCAVQALAYVYKGFFNRFESELKQGLFEVVMLDRKSVV